MTTFSITRKACGTWLGLWDGRNPEGAYVGLRVSMGSRISPEELRFEEAVRVSEDLVLRHYSIDTGWSWCLIRSREDDWSLYRCRRQTILRREALASEGLLRELSI